MDRPVVRRPVGHKRPTLRPVEVPLVSFCGHQPTERRTRLQARHARPNQPLRRPTLGRFALGRGDRPSGRFARGLLPIGITREALHLGHQPLHPTRAGERSRRFGLRVDGERRAPQRRQAGDLILLVLCVVDPGSRPRPGANPPPSTSTTTASGTTSARGASRPRRPSTAFRSRSAIGSAPASWASRRTWLSLMAMLDITTPSVASRNEGNRAVAVTMRSTTDEL